MSFKASDGRSFPAYAQLQKYERWLQEEGKAPGGPAHIHDLTEHGPVKKLTITREEIGGRHRIEATHADGHIHTSVYPDAQRVHGIAADMLGIQPLPSQAVHQRSRAHPIGETEKARIDREDGRAPEPPQERP